MRSKKELIILVLIIAAAAGYLFMCQKDRLTYELPQLDKIDIQKIAKLTVTNPEGQLHLEKKADRWLLMPQGHPADSQKVDAMLTTIANLTVTTVVAEKSSDARYDLDPDHRVEVTAWDEKKVLRQFSLGKAADTFRHTFVKLPDDRRVFHARDNFRDRFVLSATTLRDKQVLDFTPDEIASIVVTRNDQTFEWVAIENKPMDDAADQPTVARQWKTTAQKELDHAKINELLETLAALNCQSYLDPGDPATSSTAVWTIQLHEAVTTHSFTLYPSITQDEETLWPAASSTASDPFLLSDWQAKDFREIMDQLTLPAELKTGTNTSKEKS